MDDALLAQLRQKASHPQPHPNSHIPTDDEVAVLKELYQKVAHVELARVFGITPATLRKWWSLYGK
jgi:hypothetical protein